MTSSSLKQLTEFFLCVLRGGRTNAAETVSARSGDGDAGIGGQFTELPQYFPRHRGAGNSNGHRVLRAGDEIGCASAARKDEGHRTGPELAHQFLGVVRDMSYPCTRSVSAVNVGDQRMIGGTALCGEDTGNGVGIVSPCTEAVDRFGGDDGEITVS